VIAVVSMHMRPAVALALALCACGDDGFDPNSCKPDGVADIDGMIKGESIGPFVRAQEVTTGSMIGISLDEVAGACGEVVPTGKHLVFLFCAAPVVGPYMIASEQTFHCPTGDVLALIEKNGGEDFAIATSGSLTIDHAGGCADGTYTATFGLDELNGTFDAVDCR